MIPRRPRLLGLLALALLLSACTINFNTQVQPDGSGVWQTEFGLNAQDIEMLESSGSSADQFCSDMETDLPEGGTVVLEERGDERWCVTSAPFANLDELRDIYAEMDGMTVNALELQGGEFVYDIQIDMAEGEGTKMGAFTPNMTWLLTVPGRVIETNATSQDGQQLSWEMKTDEVLMASARSSTSAGLALPRVGNVPVVLTTAVLSLCCCTALLGGVGGGAFVFLRRRQQQTPPPAFPQQ